MRCENCGEKLPKGCTFCKHCNTPVKKKQTLIEKIGKVPIIISVAVVAVAAVGVLFFALSSVPTVKYEKEPDTAKYVTRVREVTFFDRSGSQTGTAADAERQMTNSLGTMFVTTAAGDLYIVRPDDLIKADEGISVTRLFGCAENADIVYYEKDDKIVRYDGAVTELSPVYGIAQFVTVSPDGSCAAWGASDRGDKKVYVSRNGNIEELSGAEEIVSITDDGSLMIGISNEQLVVCADNSRTFTPVCKCGSVREVSGDRTKVIFTDEHNPPATYLYDHSLGEPVFLYPGSLTVYSPDCCRPVSDNFDLFVADVTNHKAGTHSLMLFSRDGSSYKTKTLLDLDMVSKYRLSANGDKVLYLKEGTLAVKSTVSSFAKENIIADNVFSMYADSSLRDIYFVTPDYELYWSDGGAPVKLTLNVGAEEMIYDGVITFISDGTLYYSEHGGDITRGEGIEKVKFLTGGTAISEDEEQYITFDGKKFINTGIKRY